MRERLAAVLARLLPLPPAAGGARRAPAGPARLVGHRKR